MDLRKSSTYVEDIIWYHLAGKKLGVKFRRQHPIANYIADFYCHLLKLVIEIDGAIYNRPEIQVNDKVRQSEIEFLSIRVIRFTNEQVIKSREDVLNQIMCIIKELKEQ